MWGDGFSGEGHSGHKLHANDLKSLDKNCKQFLENYLFGADQEQPVAEVCIYIYFLSEYTYNSSFSIFLVYNIVLSKVNKKQALQTQTVG